MSRSTYDDFYNADIFDTRDLIEALEATEDGYDEYRAAEAELETETDKDLVFGLKDTLLEHEDDHEEHEQLLEFKIECDGTSDYVHGETVISGDYFEEYVEDLCIQCGYIPEDLPWWISIDWAATASSVEIDYHRFTIDNKDFLIRKC